MEKTLELKVEEAWNNALGRWNHPSIPPVIMPQTQEEIKRLGKVGQNLQSELAFMKFPEFQVYAHGENIMRAFAEDPQRGLQAVLTHEQGHRFCPYDMVTLILLQHATKQGLEGIDITYDKNAAAQSLVNLFADMIVNTTQARKGNQDIPWAYQQLSKEKQESRLWKVYAASMERAWKTKLLPDETAMNQEEQEAAEELARLFERNVLDKNAWRDKIKTYAHILGKFLEDERKDRSASWDHVAGNIPQQLDDKTAEELAKRLAEIGSDGLPTKSTGLKEFQQIMAGFEKGNLLEASIAFYEALARAYDVTFATRPFGRARTSPFQPEKWHPSMGADALDVQYSMQLGGKIIPGINAYAWKSRKREHARGVEEVVPNLDLYLDSSGTMPNPLETISLPVVAGFVAAKKAHRKNAQLRVTNFSGQGQVETKEWTRELPAVYRTLVKYYDGGTVFPSQQLLASGDPKQVLIITDTFLHNTNETAEAVEQLLKRNRGNKVTIYAIHPVHNAEDLRKKGAEIIQGTTTDIFRKVIGKAHDLYTQ